MCVAFNVYAKFLKAHSIIQLTAIINRLRAVGPHVWAFCEINIARMKARLRLVVLQNVEGTIQIQFSLTLFKHVDAR